MMCRAVAAANLGPQADPSVPARLRLKTSRGRGGAGARMSRGRRPAREGDQGRETRGRHPQKTPSFTHPTESRTTVWFHC